MKMAAFLLRLALLPAQLSITPKTMDSMYYTKSSI